MKIKRSLILYITIILNACSSQTLDNYSASSPTFNMKEFFNGELVAYGMLQNRSGKMTRRFTASLSANWIDERGTLHEEFLFDDGEIQTRIWNLIDHGNGYVTGTADDVIGEASGNNQGAVFQWSYQLDIPYGRDTIVVTLDDWLYLIDKDHLINKTKLTKFGFKVGELTLIIEKIPTS